MWRVKSKSVLSRLCERVSYLRLAFSYNCYKVYNNICRQSYKLKDTLPLERSSPSPRTYCKRLARQRCVICTLRLTCCPFIRGPGQRRSRPPKTERNESTTTKERLPSCFKVSNEWKFPLAKLPREPSIQFHKRPTLFILPISLKYRFKTVVNRLFEVRVETRRYIKRKFRKLWTRACFWTPRLFLGVRFVYVCYKR